MGLRMKNLFITYLLYLLFLGFTEKSDFQGRGGEGSRKGNVQWGTAEKRGGLGQFVDLRKEGDQEERGGDVFEGRVDAPMHTMLSQVSQAVKKVKKTIPPL